MGVPGHGDFDRRRPSRSRILKRAAVKYNSQALEADALHFSTDIWSSSVVIVGLFGVVLAGGNPRLAFLHRADAIAALGVALIVIYVSIELVFEPSTAYSTNPPMAYPGKLKKLLDGSEACWTATRCG